jgi:hypothetical protein
MGKSGRHLFLLDFPPSSRAGLVLYGDADLQPSQPKAKSRTDGEKLLKLADYLKKMPYSFLANLLMGVILRIVVFIMR